MRTFNKIGISSEKLALDLSAYSSSRMMYSIITCRRGGGTGHSSSSCRRQDDLRSIKLQKLRSSSKFGSPYSMAVMIEEKSPNRTRSAASFATSDPLPMAIPQSAALREGASLTPSPVTATQFPSPLKVLTMRSFCSGVVRAKTISWYWHNW